MTHAVVGTKLCWKKAGCSLKLNGKNHARSLIGQLLVHMSGALEQDYPGVSVQLGTLPPKTMRIKKFTTHPLFFVFQRICPCLNIFVFLSPVMNHEGVTSHSTGPLSLIQSLNQQSVCVCSKQRYLSWILRHNPQHLCVFGWVMKTVCFQTVCE